MDPAREGAGEEVDEFLKDGELAAARGRGRAGVHVRRVSTLRGLGWVRGLTRLHCARLAAAHGAVSVCPCCVDELQLCKHPGRPPRRQQQRHRICAKCITFAKPGPAHAATVLGVKEAQPLTNQEVAILLERWAAALTRCLPTLS